ncbi:MAG TPA: glycine zipper domain-containing protein [Fluviicoccus sp.]|nr:glycine zipper domain-containing protein [Fluviicoccus sp.]
MNNRTLPLLALSALLASGTTLAADNGAIVGAAVGGAVGAAIGQQTGGKDGAIIGGAIGGATGAALGSGNTKTQTTQTVVVKGAVPQQKVIYVRDRDDDRHDNGLHRGHYKHKRKHHHHHD